LSSNAIASGMLSERQRSRIVAKRIPFRRDLKFDVLVWAFVIDAEPNKPF
jgi:hypothetical protein